MVKYDSFGVRKHGEAAADLAAMLDSVDHSIPEPGKDAKRRFEWLSKGSGLYVAKTTKEAAAWAQLIRQWSPGDNVMDFSASELMHVSRLLPPTPKDTLVRDTFESFGILSRRANPTLDLPGTINDVIQESRSDPNETDVFIVRCHDIPDRFANLAAFSDACRAGNSMAVSARGRTRKELRESMGWDDRHIDSLQRRIRTYVHAKIRDNPNGEAAVAALRAEGNQISDALADALEYEYHRLVGEFIDAGAKYRKLPDNTKVALIVGPRAFESMATDAGFFYSTVREIDELGGLGINGLGHNPASEISSHANSAQQGVWMEDPGKELQRALLVFAEYNLPAAPLEA